MEIGNRRWALGLLVVAGGCFDKPAAPAARQVVRLNKGKLKADLIQVRIPLFVGDGKLSPALFVPPGQLAITDDAGAQVAFEIEPAPTNPQVVWVEVNTLKVDQTTTLTLSADPNAGAITQPPVWSDPYWAVWHFGGAGRTQPDETPGMHTATGSGSPAAASSGRVGPGLDVTGGQTYSTSPLSPPPPQSDLTISAWVMRPSVSTTGAHVVVSQSDASGVPDSISAPFAIEISANGRAKGSCATIGAMPALAFGATPLPDGWHHVTVVCEALQTTLYVDGQTPVTTGQALATFRGLDAQPIHLGGDGGATTFDGYLDEVRIERTARTAEEISLDYLAQRDLLASYDPPGAAP